MSLILLLGCSVCFTCSDRFRQGEKVSSFQSKLGQYLLELLDCGVDLIQENHNDFLSDSVFSGSAVIASFRSFLRTPIFTQQKDQNFTDVPLYDMVIQSMERLLKALAKVYEEYSSCVKNLQSDTILPYSSACDSVVNTCSVDNDRSRIVDMELDVNDDSRDSDILSVGGKISSVSASAEKWKFGMISLISRFFPVLHVVTWNILSELMDKECDSKVYFRIIALIIQKLYYLIYIFIFYIQVCERIAYDLCQHPHWSSSTNITDLVWQ